MGTTVNDQSRNSITASYSGLCLEFGVMFHSVFIGLALAVSGDEFKSLYIVLVFHQMFEGLGLGTRIATTNWARHRYTPWILAICYTLYTIAVPLV